MADTRVIATYRADRYSHPPVARLTIESAVTEGESVTHPSRIHSAALYMARYVWGEHADIIKVSEAYGRTRYSIIHKSPLSPTGRFIPRHGHSLYASLILDGVPGDWHLRESDNL